MPVRNAKGFSLIELIVAVCVSMVILGGIYMAVNSTQHNSTSIERRVTAQQDVKPALDIMALELSMASYNPTYSTNLWVDPSTCAASGTTNQTYRGIQEATDTSIAVEMDINGSSGSDGDGVIGDTNEIIRYNYNTANMTIMRNVNCTGSQFFLGSTVTGQKTVRVINNTLGIPVFRYFNGQGNEIAVSGTNLGGLITDIRRIEIVLAVETEDIDVNTGQRKRLIYSTSVIPRNHAIR